MTRSSVTPSLYHLTISVEDDRPVCDEIRIERRPGEPAVTRATLKDVPISTLLRDSVAVAGRVRFHKAEPGNVLSPDGSVEHEYGSEELATAIQSSLLQAYDARQGVRLTDELLQGVADVYREAHANGQPPTQAVARQGMVSRSTAGRYVQRARERGFLKPTRQRVAGEQD
jgi:hypothetical protein